MSDEVIYSRWSGGMSARWPNGSTIEVITSNGNPNHSGGLHTNGPPPYWWRESGDGWVRTFDAGDMSQRDITSGLSHRVLGNILMAGSPKNRGGK